MFFLLPLVGAAVGAAVGALTTHAAGEKDRQAAKCHRQVANDLSSKYSNLEKKYNRYCDEYVEKSKQQINELTRQHAYDEEEKDLLRLAIRLQQSLYTLMWDIDKSPTRETLIKFEKAVLATNTVLFELKEKLIQVPDEYFSRNLERANEVLAELSVDDVVEDNIYRIKESLNYKQRNRVSRYWTASKSCYLEEESKDYIAISPPPVLKQSNLPDFLL